MDRDLKRLIREEKRVIKRAGNKRARRLYKQDIAENPEEAAFHNDPRYGRYRSEPLNGLDQDATRRRTILEREQAASDEGDGEGVKGEV